MAALGCGHGGLEASRSAPHHDDRAAPAGEGEDGRLEASTWVFDAAEPSVEPHAADALLVTGQAGTDVGGMTRPGLGAEVGVGNLAPHDAHEVAHAVGQGPVGLQRVLEPADSDHRQVHRITDGARDEQRVSRRDLHAGLDHVERGCRHADRGVDVVDLPARLDHAGHGDGVVDTGTALDELVSADPHTERHAAGDGGSDSVDDLEQEPGPVGEGSSVLVGAPVGGRRQKAPHDRRVGALELDAVEASGRAVGGNGGVAVDDLGDLMQFHGFGDFAEQGVGHRAGCPHGQPGVHRGGLAAVVVDLGEHRHVVGVDGIGDPLVAVDHPGVESVDELLVGPVRRVGGVLFGDDQTGPAGGPGRVVGGVLLGRDAVGGVVGQMGGEHDPVGHRHRPEA